VVEQYLRAHRLHSSFQESQIGPFDRILLGLSLRSQAALAMADTYACMLASRSMLRKKLVLLLAILESSPGMFDQLETPSASSAFGARLTLGALGVRFGAVLAFSVLVLLPVRLVLLLSSSHRRG
jgi:hypothetical protein